MYFLRFVQFSGVLKKNYRKVEKIVIDRKVSIGCQNSCCQPLVAPIILDPCIDIFFIVLKCKYVQFMHIELYSVNTIQWLRSTYMCLHFPVPFVVFFPSNYSQNQNKFHQMHFLLNQSNIDIWASNCLNLWKKLTEIAYQ